MTIDMTVKQYEQGLSSYIHPTKKHKNIKQGVTLTGRNRTGQPCSVGRPITHAAGSQRARRPASSPAGSVTDDDRRQTPASKTILAH